MQSYRYAVPSTVIKECRYLIAELLKEFGFKLMAKHAQDELNVEILKGYVRVIEIYAMKKSDYSIIDRLAANRLI